MNRFILRARTVLRAVLRIIPTVRNHGGWLNTLRKVRALYANEGWDGIRRGVRVASSQAGPSYSEWIKQYDTVNDETRRVMQARIAVWANQPCVSIVMPTYNPKAQWLIEAIESVRKQIYTNWELCIADDASTDSEVRPILQRYAEQDSRIKVIFREKNGHISAASNSALALATGEWIALLDHDDVLAEHALFWVVDAINQNEHARLIYSDEDKLAANGVRLDPYFKCDWNRTLFYSHNLITHLGVYDHQLVRQIGGFQLGVEGAQDYDLALRCIEHIDTSQIHHIPRVLYHWRIHEGSTSTQGDAKPYAMLAGERALNAHFERLGIQAKAELTGHGFRTHHVLPDVPPMVSIIIPTRNGRALIQQCIESILHKTGYPNYEILIIDNGSDETESLEYFAKASQADNRVHVIRDDRPFNYSALNNAGVEYAQGDYVALLNNDIEVISPEWLSEMMGFAIQPGIGAVGARLWYPNDTLQHGGIVLGIGGWAGHANKGLHKGQLGYAGRASLASEFSAVTGACLLVSKALYKQVGGLNAIDLQVACNDVDFCLRLNRAGYRNVFTPHANLYHHESATRGYEDTPEKKARFSNELNYMKTHWGHQLLNDPAYSPNLTLDREDFSIAWSPRVEQLHTARILEDQQEEVSSSASTIN